MNRRIARRLALAGLLSTVGAVIAAPAGAEDVDVTVTVEAAGTEALFVTHTTAPIMLDAVTFAATDQDATGGLPQTTVTDGRGSLLGGSWTVTVSGTDFTYQSATTGIAPEDVPVIGAADGYVYVDALANLVSGTVVGALNGTAVVGGADVGNVTADNLGTPYTLINGTTAPLQSSATATYTPTIRVTVPANTPAGEYTGTVTQTVS